MKEQVSEALKSVLPYLGLGLTEDQVLEAASKTAECKPEFGSVTNPCVMELSKQLQMKPRVLAQQIADAVAQKLPGITVSVTGPGFLNFK